MDKKLTQQMVAKKCYGHLGGKLGNLLFERMLELKWFEPKEGKSTVYEITEKGYQELAKLGMDLSKIQSAKEKQK
ncbi:MAG: ArsR family transcriptional regulator [Candidatus Aminicenantia bacterium]